MTQTIKFYRQTAPWGEFSNFYVRDITIDGKTWKTNEHFFQAMKSEDEDVQEAVRKLGTAMEAKRFGNQIARREDWESVAGTEGLQNIFRDPWGIAVERVKDHFMYTAILCKFTQHDDLRKLLLSTGDAIIIEDTQSVGRDPYWGNGPDGNGQNKLGRMLMLARTALSRV